MPGPGLVICIFKNYIYKNLHISGKHLFEHLQSVEKWYMLETGGKLI